MSDLRFALLTTVIITFAYITALSVSSLDRVLAYVGSTGSTSTSFILPGLFYYKISHPDSPHHQRLVKEDDDADSALGGTDGEGSSAGGAVLGRPASVSSLASGRSRSGRHNALWASLRLRKKWRWDLEHIEPQLLRKMSLALAIYGFCVMTVCLVMNTFFVARPVEGKQFAIL